MDIDNEIIEDSEHKYFTMIPNIIYDLGLSVHAVVLYCILKRIAGDRGKCWMSTENLAQKCNMSTGAISDCKKELSEKGLIVIENKSVNNKHYHEIKIVDVWRRNIDRYLSSSPSEYAGSPHELAGSPSELIKNSINNNPDIRVQEILQITSQTKESVQQATIESIARGLKKKMGEGLENYPEDIRPVLDLVCRLWNFKVPRGRTGGQMAFWIQSGRELKDACGEYEAQVLEEVRKDFEDYMSKHGGLAPYTVSSPKSLVNMARAKAAIMRTPEKEALNVEVYYGDGTKYVPGRGVVPA